MPALSARSKENLVGVHPKLIDVVTHANEILALAVLDGVRTDVEQAAYKATGKSKTLNSKHLLQPDGYSHAVDLAPLMLGNVDWKDIEMFCVLAGVMFACSTYHAVKLRWGGDWDSDKSTRDETFRDYGHFELVL